MTEPGRWSQCDLDAAALEARWLLAVPAEADGDAWQRSGYVAAMQRARATYGSL